MKAVTLSGFGDIDVLNLSAAPVPELKSGQVRIRVRASGVNRADLVQRRGHYPPPAGESLLLGLEVAGEILEPNGSRFRAGEKVMALLAGGGYAEEVTVDAGLVLPLPPDYSFAEGAAVMEVFLTAHLNLFTLGGARSGSRVLIHAGASGVGTAGIQLLRSAGAVTWVTVGSPEKAAACEKLGAHPIQYRTEKFENAIATATSGKGVDVILDPVGASYLAENIRTLGPDGRLILIGLMGGTEAPLDLRAVQGKRLQIKGSGLRPLPIETKREVVATFARAFYDRLVRRDIHPIVDRVFPIAEVREAHRYMESNANIGKIILQW